MADEHLFERTHGGGFTVVGWETRTTNAQEMTANGVIPRLWQRVRSQNALATVPDRADRDAYVLYTDYESDKDGAYTYLLGARVTIVGTLPIGMVVRHVPEGLYAALAIRKNPAPSAVLGLWQQIWAFEAAHKIARAYGVDYERHHLDGQSETSVELYVGLKK